MSAGWVFLAYGASVAVSLYLLWHFHAQSWYWHVLSVLVAFAIGLAPPLPGISGSQWDLAIGSVFTFLFLWGVAAPLFRAPKGG
jgi:hypothetical protein